MREFFHPRRNEEKHWLRFATVISVWALLCSAASAIDNSVPYVLDGLPTSGPAEVLGFGATVGQIEVRNGDGNGIDGFDGHRHVGLTGGTWQILSGSTLTIGSYGYQDVQDFSVIGTGTPDPSDSNFHGTFVAGIMANVPGLAVTVNGTTIPFSGVAPGAAYYGAIFNGADSKAGLLTLKQSLDYLVNTEHVQTINNSWGGVVASAAELDGTNAVSLMMDEYVGYRGKTGGSTGGYKDKLMVIAAGNSGTGTGLLGVPADSYNGLVVGALNVADPNATGLTDAGRVPVAQIAPYSSYKPLANGRSGVDVVAPGTNIWSDLAINVAVNDFHVTTNTDSVIAGAADGTSFAAPHVTGEAALLYGAGTFPITSGVTDKGTPLSTDHKLIKAIIINSADKIAGKDENGNAQATWQPGKVITGSISGVPTAVAPLNYAVGAGKANANSAFLEYKETGNRFWDVNTLSLGTTDVYYTFGQGKFLSGAPDQQILLGLTATLVWDRHVDFTVNEDANSANIGTVATSLSDLDLVLQEEIAPGTWQDIFISSGVLGNLGHIYMPLLDGTYNYRLDIRAITFADKSLGEEYALAVDFQTVPEPAAVVLIAFGVGIFFICKMWHGNRRPREIPMQMR
jgi:subtilisin family serine protease